MVARTNTELIWPTATQIEDKIEEEGKKFTASFWMKLQARDKLVLTLEQAELYNIVQKAHIRLTGYSLPDTIKGAMKTRAQIRNELGTIDEGKVEAAVQGGLAAKLAKLRKGN